MKITASRVAVALATIVTLSISAYAAHSGYAVTGLISEALYGFCGAALVYGVGAFTLIALPVALAQNED